jgi:hypothetical protein
MLGAIGPEGEGVGGESSRGRGGQSQEEHTVAGMADTVDFKLVVRACGGCVCD